MRRSFTISVLVALLILMVGMSYAQNPVTFQINMSIQMILGNFDPATDSVVVRGDFNGWSGVQDMCTDPDGDSVYTVTIDIPGNAGDVHQYKYVMTKPNSDDIWENDPNRQFTLAGGAQTLDVVYWNNITKINPKLDATVFFTCDMSVQILAGNFDPANDPISVRGSFNGWGQDPMSQDLFNPNLFSAAVNMDQAEANVDNFYKYYYEHGTNQVWESPLSTGGGNRTFVIPEDAQDLDNDGRVDVLLDTVFFNDMGPDQIFPEEHDVVFEVDMRPAYAYLATFDSIPSAAPPGFEKSIDSVFIAGDSPNTTPTFYWVWDHLNQPDLIKPLKMNDAGQNGDLVAGDSIFSITITFHAGAPRIPDYKYGINAHDNEAGFAKNHLENVYEPDNNFRHRDEFGEQDTLFSKVWTGIADDNSFTIPEVYKIFQNYPNPFNPTTTITYALTRSANVKLVIYNVLGQKVRTLVDGKKNAGVYRVLWDGRNDAGEVLGSGVYFYRFQAGDYTKTMKMILMR